MHWEHTIIERLGDIYLLQSGKYNVNTMILLCIYMLPLAELLENRTITVLHVKSRMNLPTKCQACTSDLQSIVRCVLRSFCLVHTVRSSLNDRS